MTDSNRIIWVTGGAGYLGSSIVSALDAQGRKSLVIDLPGKAEALIASRKLRHATAVSLDLGTLTDADRTVGDLCAAHGVPDGLVQLTFASSSGKRLDELKAADFAATLDRSLTPSFVFCRAVAERMVPRQRGSVVMFASMYGLVAPDPRIYSGPMAPNPIDYGASKAALIQMMRYFAVHYGPHGVRFNCVAPGPFPNPGIQQQLPEFITRLSAKTVLNRVGRTEEIAGPTLFLLGDDSSYVTGHTLTVDGGWTTW